MIKTLDNYALDVHNLSSTFHFLVTFRVACVWEHVQHYLDNGVSDFFKTDEIKNFPSVFLKNS